MRLVKLNEKAVEVALTDAFFFGPLLLEPRNFKPSMLDFSFGWWVVPTSFRSMLCALMLEELKACKAEP